MRKIGIIIYMIVIGFVLTSQSHGKEFDWIKTTADLREAIDEADDNGKDDIIILPEGTFDIDKTLTFIRHDGKSITFQGAGKDKTILDGGGNVQIMVIKSETGNEGGSHTIVRGVTFQNGYSGDDRNTSDNGVSKGSGGGLYIHTWESDLKVEDVKFIGNKTNMREPSGDSKVGHALYGGGGLHAIGPTHKDLHGEIINCEFENNESTNGGGLYVKHMGIVSGCKFVNNKASINGGGLFAGVSANLTIDNSDFTENRSDLTIHDEASQMLGGGALAVIPASHGTAKIVNCRIDNNQSLSSGGGAVFLNIDFSYVIRTRFANNAAIGDGGGLWAHGDLLTYNNIFDQNQSSANGGGLWLMKMDRLWSHNNTIVRNKAELNGGGLYFAVHEEVIISNNIFWANTVDTNGKGRDLYQDKYENGYNEGRIPYIINNAIDIMNGADLLIGGEPIAELNLSVDPKVQMDDGTYNLEAGSECINSGKNSVLSEDVWRGYEEVEKIRTDFNGNNRVANDVIDIGAVEYGAEVVNRPPTAENQTVTIIEDTANHPIRLKGADADGNALTFTITQGPDNGDWTGELPDLRYTPKADYHGKDQIIFIVSDGDKTATGKVAISITPVKDPPVANNRSVAVIKDSKDTPIDCSGSDADGDALTYKISIAPINGQLSEGKAPIWYYTPNSGFEGDDEFEFTVDDGNGSRATATVAITVAGTVAAGHPVVENIEVTVDKNSSDNAITCTGADSDNDPLTYTVSSAPSRGTINAAEMPNLYYTPDPDFSGKDTFTYTVTDDDNNAATGTVTITVGEEVNNNGTSGADRDSDNDDGGGGGGGGCFIQHLLQN